MRQTHCRGDKTGCCISRGCRGYCQKAGLLAERVVAVRDAFTVHANRWENGWELHIDGVGVTQSFNLDDADRMVRDYIATLTGRTDTDQLKITIIAENSAPVARAI